MGNNLYGNGNGSYSHGNQFPSADDFSDMCDPEDMGEQHNELAEYVNMKIAKDIDMIEFWKENRALLPQLFKVTCRVLYVPVSSSATERVFSTAGRLLENGDRTSAWTRQTACCFCIAIYRHESSASDDNFILLRKRHILFQSKSSTIRHIFCSL